MGPSESNMKNRRLIGAIVNDQSDINSELETFPNTPQGLVDAFLRYWYDSHTVNNVSPGPAPR